MAENTVQQQQDTIAATMDISQRLEKLKQDMKSPDVSVDELEKRVKNLRMTSASRDNDVTFEDIETRLNMLKGKKPPVIRVLSIKRKFDDGEGNKSSGTSRDNEDDQVKRLIRQYTSDDLIDDLTADITNQQTDDDVIAAHNLLEGLDDNSAALIRKLMEEKEMEKSEMLSSESNSTN